jgi:signal transduction histidine kinase
MSGYLIAVAAVAASALLRLILDPIFVTESPMLAFVVGVAVASLYGGLWPGLFATVLSIFVGDYLFIEPRMTFGIWSTLDVSRVALFAFEGIVIAYLSGQRRDSLEANRVLAEQIRRHNEELDAEVRRRTAELQQSNESLETFVHTISHDLTAPLRSIRGFADIIQEDFGGQLADRGREYTERISGAVHRLEVLVHNLLAYTKLQQREITFDTVSLDRIARDVVQDMADDIQRAGGRVEADANLGSVLANADTLGLILVNLISNGLKFVPHGRAPHLRIGARPRGGMIRVSVTDNGIGIAPDDRTRVFKAFERLQTQDTYAGSGLGLALVARGVERMNGTCGVDAGEAGGSEFWFQLPAVLSEDGDGSSNPGR